MLLWELGREQLIDMGWEWSWGATHVQSKTQAETAHAIQATYETVTEGKMRLVHVGRLDTAKYADTIFVYDTSIEPHQKDSVFTDYPEWKVIQKKNTYKLAIYGQTKLHPTSRFTITTGIRYDYMRYIKKGTVDSRIGLSFNILDGTWVNLAVGQQSQSPAYISLIESQYPAGGIFFLQQCHEFPGYH